MGKQGVVWLAQILALLAYSSSAEASISGKWANPSKSVIIDIEPCGHGLCGTVVWASTKAKHDARKGTSHLVGTKLLTGLHLASSHEWKGQLFVPDENMHATAKLRPEGASHLKVSGCKLMICRSQLWTKSTSTHAKG